MIAANVILENSTSRLQNLLLLLLSLEEFKLCERVARHLLRLNINNASPPQDDQDTNAVDAVAYYLEEIGNNLVSQAMESEALRYFEAALAKRMSCFGRYHYLCLKSLRSIGKLLCNMERYDDAINVLKQCLDSAPYMYGTIHAETATAADELGMTLSKVRLYDNSDAFCFVQQGLHTRIQVMGADDLSVAKSMHHLGTARFHLAGSVVLRCTIFSFIVFCYPFDYRVLYNLSAAARDHYDSNDKNLINY
jgi:tetratricopeptide (TPR) repeat protein